MRLFDSLSEDDRAVSPVIGVVLMIAVVVILAAVVGAFATGIFGSQNEAPQAAFSYDASTETVTMDSGESIPGDEIQVNGQDNPFGDDPVEAGSTATGISPDGEGFVRVTWNDGSGNSAILFETQVDGSGGGGSP